MTDTSPKERRSRSRRPNMGFAFGMFETQSGFAVSHQYDRSPSIIRPGNPVTLRVQTVHGYGAVTAFVLDGAGPYDPQTIREAGTATPFERDGDEWSGLVFGSRNGTIQHYIIEATDHSGSVRYADGGHSLDTATVFAHRVTDRNPPEWTNDAVIYQIFVDRFANAAGTVTQPDDPMGWGGGDLDGVTDHLDWIKDLGANCIWITPVFTCQSYHGYDSLDYHSVDERFGGNDAFRRLIDETHRRDMKILMDIVPNHVSNNHEWFQRALAGGPERDWFDIDSNGNYQTFFSAQSMPSFNRRYGGLLDGVTDFAFAYGLREYLAGSITAEGFASLEREAIGTHPAEQFSWVRFFDNHDMERGLTRWQNDQASLAHATDILMSLPGVPTIFYGTEQALTSGARESQGGLEVGRIPMTFDRAHPMYEATRAAIARRRSRSVDQSAPVWWQPDGSWTWDRLRGDLSQSQES